MPHDRAGLNQVGHRLANSRWSSRALDGGKNSFFNWSVSQSTIRTARARQASSEISLAAMIVTVT
jgi:hypothetical protein